MVNFRFHEFLNGNLVLFCRLLMDAKCKSEICCGKKMTQKLNETITLFKGITKKIYVFKYREFKPLVYDNYD